MRTKPWGSRCNRKRRKNSSSEKGMSFWSLLWAESRQRNVTLPSATETRRRHHTMYMRVKFEFLTPGMQHAEEADLCTEMLRIVRDLQKSFRTGAKQEIVDDLLVLQDQGSQMTRKCEDHMDVRCREKLLATRSEPPIPTSSLTLPPLPISPHVLCKAPIPPP